MRVCRERDPWFGQDKAKHFFGSALIAAGATTLALEDDRGDGEAAAIGASAALAAGLGKELYDGGVKKTCFSWRDLVWDFLGASVGASAAAAVVD